MTFVLRRPPPEVSQSFNKGVRLVEIPIFEPFEESLPLQTGWYSFIIDEKGNFRVKRGMTSSHSAMAPDRRAAAAGRFRVNRMGRVVEVVCQSLDFRQYYDAPSNKNVKYLPP